MSDLQTSATLPTPGPWLVYEDSEIYSGEPSDELLATVYPMKRDGIHDSWKANARLIAAAPEMLEALEGVSSEDYSLDKSNTGGERCPSGPHCQSKPRRLDRWTAMTVAAGFRFSKGILICADTEITNGAELKEKGTKVFPYTFKKSGNKAIFTFSGDVFASKQCIQSLARGVAALPPNKWSSEEVLSSLSESLHSFHHKYIFKHPNYQFGTGPQVNLIIGAWCEDEKRLALYQSSEEHLIETSDIEPVAVTGTGAAFARYIARPMVPHPEMALHDVLTVAVHALKEAKDNVPGCGIATELLTISTEGEIGSLGWLHSSQVEHFAESFAAGIRHLFVETCDLGTPEQQVRHRFEQMWTIIEATRAYLKEQRDKPDSFSALIDHMVKRKTKEL